MVAHLNLSYESDSSEPIQKIKMLPCTDPGDVTMRGLTSEMSSSCPHCHAFKKNVLSNAEFISYANEKLIVVIHDYDILDKLPADEKKARNDLMTKLKVENFPTILLIDKTGIILLRTSGYGGTPAGKIIASLKAALKE